MTASQLFVPGPAFIYFAPFTAYDTPGSYVYLGESEGDVNVSDDAAWEDIIVDQSGPRVPFDLAYMAEECYIQFTLVKYVEAAWEALATRVAGTTWGTIEAGQVGTLVRQEGKCYAFAITSPYQSKAAYASMPPGYTFKNGVMHNNWDMSLSTQRQRKRVVLRCIPDWQVDGSGILFTPTIPSLPAVT